MNRTNEVPAAEDEVDIQDETVTTAWTSGSSEILDTVLGGAATCSEGFVKCFQRVPTLLGCTAATMLPKQASKGNLKKTYNKTFGTSGRPNQ